MISNLKILHSNETDLFIDNLLNIKSPQVLGFLNQYAFNLICSSHEVSKAFNKADFLLRDGKGVELACRYLNIDPGENLNGTDFIPRLVGKIVAEKERLNLFVYGTKSPWLERGSENLFKGNCCYVLDGFGKEESYVDHFSQYQCSKSFNLIVLAMGMPKQEVVAALLKEVALSRTLIICGGAIIDFQGGRFSRSPRILRDFGLEWLYRLSKEPVRLFRRYVIGIPLFFYNVVTRKHEALD